MGGYSFSVFTDLTIYTIQKSILWSLLHQVSASTQSQCRHGAGDIGLIELGCNPFWSVSINSNESCNANIIAALTLTLGANDPNVDTNTDVTCEQTLKGMAFWLSYPNVETPVGSDDMKVSNITWFVRKWSI